MKFLFLLVLISTLAGGSSCSGETRKKDISAAPKDDTTRIPSGIDDTLTINYKAAVFYYPDSFQLEKIKARTGAGIFEASMHEYESQLRVSHTALKDHWPGITVVEARKERFIRFTRSDKKEIIIDLDKEGDPYGLIVFNMIKDPVHVDMMNVDTQLYYYFSK